MEGIRIRVDYTIRRGDEVLATGHTLHVFTDAAHRPTRPPREFVSVVSADTAI